MTNDRCAAHSAYLEDRFACAAEHIRAAMSHIQQAAEGDPEGLNRFAARLVDAGAGKLDAIASECELIAALLDHEFRVAFEAHQQAAE
jgi:hypothetical protein